MTLPPNTFAIFQGNLPDAAGGQVPNFSRTSPVYLEAIAEDSLRLYAVQANAPAFDDSGAFYGEPSGVNLLSYNQSISNSAWQKGSNITVREDFVGQGRTAPDGTQTADRITVSPGTGISQQIKRSINLLAEGTYTLSVILMLQGGLFGSNDVIELTGGVVGSPKISLNQLNKKTDRWAILSVTFQTAGRQPNYPASPHELGAPAITAVANNLLTISIPPQYTVNDGDWVGGQIAVNGGTYTISSNTASSGGSVTIGLQNVTLSAVGIVVGQKVFLEAAAAQPVTVQLYCENVVTVAWGGIQLEAGAVRTSFINQAQKVKVRAATLLNYRKSPIDSLSTFSIYAYCKFWRGDGRLFSFGNLSAIITGGKLQITANSTQINFSDPLPPSFKLFIQVLQSNASISIYLDGVLKARTTVTNFQGQSTSFNIFFDAPVCWQWLTVKKVPLLEGQVNVGDTAKADVLELFNSISPIDSTAISEFVPMLLMPSVKIPPPAAPIASQQITAVAGTNSQTLTVSSAAAFPVNAPVLIKRGNDIIQRTIVFSASGVTVTVGSGAGALIGDYLVYGTEVPGRASVRFPNEPIDPQVISAVNSGSNQVTVASALSFTATRAVVRDGDYQDVGLFTVKAIDTVNNILTLDSVSGISVGNTIYQTATELIISPDAYLDLLLDAPPGVSVVERYADGIVIENRSSDHVIVTPAIRIGL